MIYSPYAQMNGEHFKHLFVIFDLRVLGDIGDHENFGFSPEGERLSFSSFTSTAFAVCSL